MTDNGTARSMRAEEWGENAVRVALTGYGHAGDLQTSEEAGFDHHLVKPVDPVAVMRLLRR